MAGEAQPRRRVQAGPERHPRIEGEDDVVRSPAMAPPRRPDHEPAADAEHREVGLPGLGPVGLVDDSGRELADRSEAERLEVAERLGRLRGSSASPRHVAGRQVGPDDGRPGRVDPGAEPFVDQLEGGLDARSGRRPAAEDLGDGLDRLEVGGHGKLEPGADAVAARAAARRTPSARVRASRAIPPPLGATGSPVSAAYSVSSSRWRFDSFAGTTTLTNTWRSPRDPARRRWGTPRPRSRISVPGCVPGLISTSSSPSTVGTLILVPRAAWAIETSAS